MLRISKNAGLTDVVSTWRYRKISDGTIVDTIPTGQESLYETNPAYNPITTQHPITGSVVETRLWLFNDNAAERFENINIDPTDSLSTDESTWVQLAPDNAGVASTYLAAGAALSMANISDSNVGKPFWVKVVTPAVGSVQNKTDIKLTVNYRKFAV